MANKFTNIKMIITQNWLIKLMALITAAVTFYGIRMATSQETIIDIPLTVEVRDGVAVQKQDNTSVLVTFRGSEDTLRTLASGNVRAVVRAKAEDLEMPETVPILPRDIEGFSGGVRPILVTPTEVTVSFDSEAVEELDLEVPKIGASAPKIGVAEVIGFEPRKVKVRGSLRTLREMINKGMKIRTEPVDVEGRVESFTKMVRVLAPSGSTFLIEPSVIKVNVNIVTEELTRSLTNVVVNALVRQGSGLNIMLEPAQVVLVLSGRAEIMENLKDESIKVFADCTEVLTGGTNEVSVSVHIPSSEGIEITVDPPKVRAKGSSVMAATSETGG